MEKFQAYKSAWGAQVTSTTGYSTAYNSRVECTLWKLSLQEIKIENYCRSRCLVPECVIVYSHGHGVLLRCYDWRPIFLKMIMQVNNVTIITED